jgi:hypothetical protein
MLAKELQPASITRYALALKLAGIELPIRHDSANVGTIVDATGRGFVVVDMNRELPDAQVADIAELLTLAINSRAGLPSNSQ